MEWFGLRDKVYSLNLKSLIKTENKMRLKFQSLSWTDWTICDLLLIHANAVRNGGRCFVLKGTQHVVLSDQYITIPRWIVRQRWPGIAHWKSAHHDALARVTRRVVIRSFPSSRMSQTTPQRRWQRPLTAIEQHRAAGISSAVTSKAFSNAFDLLTKRCLVIPKDTTLLVSPFRALMKLMIFTTASCQVKS